MMYIKDTYTGNIRLYGTNKHDSLSKSEDGRCLYYANLQNGTGSQSGEVLFCEKDGRIPEEIDVPVGECYFNIGGFERHGLWVKVEYDNYSMRSCSLCNFSITSRGNLNFKYCPECGARMDENPQWWRFIKKAKGGCI